MPTYDAGDVNVAYNLETKDAEAGASRMEQLFVTMAEKLGPVGDLLTAGALGMEAFGAAAVIAAEDFAKTFQQLDFELGATSDQIDNLQGQMKDLYVDSPEGLGEIEKSLVAVEQRTKLTGKAAEAFADQMLKVSHAFGGDAGQLTRSMTAIMNLWGEGTDAIDKFTAAHQLTGVTMSQLESTMQHMGPQLKVLGFSFEETTAMLANFDKAGLNSSMIIRGMMMAMPKVGGNKEILLKDIAEIQNLLASGDAVDKAKATEFAKHLFGIRMGAQIMAAAQMGAFNTTDMMAQIGAKAPGASDQLIDKTLGAQFTELEHLAATKLAPIGAAFIEIAKDVIFVVKPLVELTGWITTNPITAELLKWGLVFKGVQMAVGPIASGIAGMLANMRTMQVTNQFRAFTNAGATIAGAATNPTMMDTETGKLRVMTQKDINAAELQEQAILAETHTKQLALDTDANAKQTQTLSSLTKQHTQQTGLLTKQTEKNAALQQEVRLQQEIVTEQTRLAEIASTNRYNMAQRLSATPDEQTGERAVLISGMASAEKDEVAAQAKITKADATLQAKNALLEESNATLANTQATLDNIAVQQRDAFVIVESTAALDANAGATTLDAAATRNLAGLETAGALSFERSAGAAATDTGAKIVNAGATGVLSTAVKGLAASLMACWPMAVLAAAVVAFEAVSSAVDGAMDSAAGLTKANADLNAATTEQTKLSTLATQLSNLQEQYQSLSDAAKTSANAQLDLVHVKDQVIAKIKDINTLLGTQAVQWDGTAAGIQKVADQVNNLPDVQKKVIAAQAEVDVGKTKEDALKTMTDAFGIAGKAAYALETWVNPKLAKQDLDVYLADVRKGVNALGVSAEDFKKAQLAVAKYDLAVANNDPAALAMKEKLDAQKKIQDALDYTSDQERKLAEAQNTNAEKLITAQIALGDLQTTAASARNSDEAYKFDKQQATAKLKIQQEQDSSALQEEHLKKLADPMIGNNQDEKKKEDERYNIAKTHLDEVHARETNWMKVQQEREDTHRAHELENLKTADKLIDTQLKGEQSVATARADLVRLTVQERQATSETEREKIRGSETLKQMEIANDLVNAKYEDDLETIRNNHKLYDLDKEAATAALGITHQHDLFVQQQKMADQTALNAYNAVLAQRRDADIDAANKHLLDVQKSADGERQTKMSRDFIVTQESWTRETTKLNSLKKTQMDDTAEIVADEARAHAELVLTKAIIDAQYNTDKIRRARYDNAVALEAIDTQLNRQKEINSEVAATAQHTLDAQQHEIDTQNKLDSLQERAGDRTENEMVTRLKLMGELDEKLTGNNALSRAAEYTAAQVKNEIALHDQRMTFKQQEKEFIRKNGLQNFEDETNWTKEMKDDKRLMIAENADKQKAANEALQTENESLNMKNYIADIDKAKSEAASLFEGDPGLQFATFGKGAAFYKQFSALPTAQMAMPYATLPGSAPSATQRLAASLALSLTVDDTGKLGAFVKQVVHATLERAQYGQALATSHQPY